MKLFIGNKKIVLTEDDIYNLYIGQGDEGCCFRIGEDEVLKLHHEYPFKKTLSKENCERLKEIETKRIILPKELVYDEEGKYVGYTLKYLENINLKSDKIKLDFFINEFKLLEEDTLKLTKNNFDMFDVSYYNTIFSNGIYMIDVGSFIYDEHDKYLERNNRNTVSSYELCDIILKIFNFTLKERIKLKMILDDDFYFTEILNMIGYNKDENAKAYFKRITK